MSRYMLDKNIPSYAMQGSHPSALPRRAAVPVRDVCISAITHAEIFYGIAISPNQVRDEERFRNFLRYATVENFSDSAGEHYGEIRAGLKRRGLTIGPNDLFIAAHARCLGLTLVTNNIREFSRVDGLKLENWAE